MKEVERRGVLIDVCPECRGVWLDRGELEKLLAIADRAEYGEEEEIRKSRHVREVPPKEARPPFREEVPHRYDRGEYEREDYRPTGHPHKKRKGWWKELFDFEFGD